MSYKLWIQLLILINFMITTGSRLANYIKFLRRFIECLCQKNISSEKWTKIAKHLKLLYDDQLDFHPEFEGYKVDTEIKQADVILLGYPLQYQMNE